MKGHEKICKSVLLTLEGHCLRGDLVVIDAVGKFGESGKLRPGPELHQHLRRNGGRGAFGAQDERGIEADSAAGR